MRIAQEGIHSETRLVSRIVYVHVGLPHVHAQEGVLSKRRLVMRIVCVHVGLAIVHGEHGVQCSLRTFRTRCMTFSVLAAAC